MAIGEICERCGASPAEITSGPFAGSGGTHDYCEYCSQDLCEKCMETGRCPDSPSGKHSAYLGEGKEEE